jgi:hypothetical protein
VNRAEWTSSVAELVGLSHEAADRRARKTGTLARGLSHVRVTSQIYLRDKVPQGLFFEVAT